MGNRGDAFWNVSLRGVRDKHSNDLSIRMQYRRSRGRGGKEKEYIFFRGSTISSMNRKIRSKPRINRGSVNFLRGDKEIREIINYNSISTGP